MDQRLAQLSLDAFARDRLRMLLGRFEQEWRKCLRKADADAIHDFRVALRRFQEALRLFKSLFPKMARQQVRQELRQMMRLAGHTRDVDIAQESFTHADVDLPAGLKTFFDNERAMAETAFSAALAVGLATHFRERWQQTLELHSEAAGLHSQQETKAAGQQEQPWRPELSSAQNARMALPRLLEEYCRQGQEFAVEGIKPARLHELRLSSKHLRYTLETFRPIYGRKMDELVACLKETQTDLGDISDATATLAWLKEHKLHRTPEAEHVRRYLEHRAAKGATHFVSYWHDHWGLWAFRERWIRYLALYAGRTAPSREQRAARAAEPASAAPVPGTTSPESTSVPPGNQISPASPVRVH